MTSARFCLCVCRVIGLQSPTPGSAEVGDSTPIDSWRVGALFVAFDLADFDKALERIVAGAKFFETGGIYVIDQRAGIDQAVLTLPVSLRGRKLADFQGGQSIATVAKLSPQPGTELHDFAPVLAPGATDRIAIARLTGC